MQRPRRRLRLGERKEDVTPDFETIKSLPETYVFSKDIVLEVVKSECLKARKAQVKAVVDLIESMRRKGNTSEENDFNSVIDDIAKAIEGQVVE